METWRIPRFCSVHQQYLFLGKQNRIRTNIDNQDWTNICENWSYNYPLINKNSWLKTGNLPFAIKNTCTFIAAFQPVLFRLEGTHPETSPSQQDSSIPNINVQGRTVTFREVRSPSLTHFQTPFSGNSHGANPPYQPSGMICPPGTGLDIPADIVSHWYL